MAVKDAKRFDRLGEVVKGDELTTFVLAGQSKPWLTEGQLKGIDEGHLLPVWADQEISDDTSPTKKGVFTVYIRLYSLDVQGMSILNNGKMKPATPKPEGEDTRTDEEKRKGACDYHDYGYDLDVKREIRGIVMKGLEGPEKAIRENIKGLRAGGWTDAEIPAMVKASPKFAGVAELDALIASAMKA